MSPNRKTHLPAFVLAAVAALLFVLPAGAAERVWSETYTLSADGRIALENINGDVEIEGWDGDQVEVTATITSRSEEALDTVDVKVDATENLIEISTEYTKRQRGWGRESAEVEYSLRVPRKARLSEIELVNGSLTVNGVAGELEASLVNGGLEARGLAGDAELSTVNGSIDVYFDRVGADQRLKLESVNGSVDLYLPAGADAEVSAETVHGRISTDFDLRVEKGEYVGSSLDGTLGGGGGQIELENVNGSITIHRR